MYSRRDLLKLTGQSCLAWGVVPRARILTSIDSAGAIKPVRCINVVNFLRGVEPREPVDLLLPLQKQMEVILEHRLPATWLLQFDALVSGPFVEFLKAHMPPEHELGIWFEMNEMHCRAAGVEWRGRPGYEWDHLPPVAFTLGYTPDERIRLADAFMREFQRVWGRHPKSVASWNLDAITMAHLADGYGVDAFAVCRDQIATDGFTIWGAPIAGYYPSKVNCWSPALSSREQISTPVFRMLGQDPVYYYQKGYPMPAGRRGSGPDTMEPVWPSGRSPAFIENFLRMVSAAPALRFAYAQLGQENSFGWRRMADAYPRQMKALAALRDSGAVSVETMGESGRRFKREFKETPAQAQVMLIDPHGNADPGERSIWYQSRFYRANLHVRGDLPYLRDLTVYSDRNAQPFLRQATRANDVEQRMPALLDGYHWSATPGSSEPGAGGYFVVDGQRLRLAGTPSVREDGDSLVVDLPAGNGRILLLRFDERKLSMRMTARPRSPRASYGGASPQLRRPMSPSGSGPSHVQLTLSFEWDVRKAALVDVKGGRAVFRWHDFEYSVAVVGAARVTPKGWSVESTAPAIELRMAQAT